MAHTDKRIEDYLHLYLPFEVEHLGSIREITGIVPGDLGFATFYTRYGFFTGTFENTKLILRPLSDMSEEEACNLEWYMWDGFPDVCFGDREETLKMFINSTDKYRPGFEPMVMAINWLRKNSFDIDGLIEAGLAIDKTILK